MRACLIPFLLFITFLSFSQKVNIKVNDVNYSNNVCDFEPHTIDYSFSNKDIKVFKGTFKLVRGKQIIQEFIIDTSMYYQQMIVGIYSVLQRNDRLILDVEKVFMNNVVRNYSMFSVVKFGDLIPVINPKGDILINNSVMYRINGISVDSIKTIKYVSDSLTELVSIRIIPIRGMRPLSAAVLFTDPKEISENHNFFSIVLPGDRILIEINKENEDIILSGGKRSISIKQSFRVINVPII